MQLEKASSPIDVTLSGILIEARLDIPEQQYDGIDFTLSPNVNSVTGQLSNVLEGKSVQFSAFQIIFDKPVQPLKAETPIDVTLLGISIKVRPVQ